MQDLSKLKIAQFFPIVLAIAALLSSQKSYSQYNLPKSEVLVKNNVRAIHVTKSIFKTKNVKKSDLSNWSLDKKPRILRSYFLDHSGRVDSVHQYYPDPAQFNRTIFFYS